VKTVKKFLALLLAVTLFLGSFPITARAGSLTNYTYTYNEWTVPIPSPDAYRVSAFILGEGLGIGHFHMPQDLHVHRNFLYVADSGNHRIVVIEFFEDTTFEVVDVRTHVYIDGVASTFNNPAGIFVSDWELTRGDIFIADTFNHRILHLDENWNLIVEITHPAQHGSLLPENLDFLPNKLVVDFSGRLFVQATHVNRGLMEFDRYGIFAGYMGAPPVEISPIDQFWRMIATREQRERMSLFVPVEYNNVSIDHEGFLFVTQFMDDEANELQTVRRLNAMGVDVMIRNGFHYPMGDLWWGEGAHMSGPSELIDVTALPNNTFVVFDRNRGRLFAYDPQGELLYAWGGPGNREGFFMLPAALDSMGFTLFALDTTVGAITRFDLTEYGTLINEALAMYQRGLYEESYDTWNEVLRMNGNFGLAYIGLARALLRRGYYREAMHFFQLQNDARNYGRAFNFYRRQWMEENFWMFVLGFGILIFVPPVVKTVLKVRKEIMEA